MKQFIFIVLCSLLMVGCSKDNYPTCSDKSVTALVIQIVEGNLQKSKNLFSSLNKANNAITYSVFVENIRTINRNNETGKNECAATINIQSNSTFFNKSKSVTYTSEITEDKGELYVTLYGFSL